MRHLPPLGALRAFEAAARQESFKRAAAELGVTPTAISHQIRQLEEGLGVALFVRQTRRVMLTEAGRALYPAMRQALDGMAAAIDALRQRPQRQVATLSATVAFTAKILVPRVARFRALNPGWDLRLHASDDLVDLEAREADAAIRYGLGYYAGLNAMPLLADNFAPVCSPHLPIQKPADLVGATLIHFDWGPMANKISVPAWASWQARAAVRGLDPDGGITFNDENSAIQAAIAGQGVALLSLSLVAEELASGALVQPFGPILEGMRYYFVCPTGADNRPEIAVLRNWVMTDIAQGDVAP